MINETASQQATEVTKNLLVRKASQNSRGGSRTVMEIKREQQDDTRSIHSEFDYHTNKDLTGFILKQTPQPLKPKNLEPLKPTDDRSSRVGSRRNTISYSLNLPSVAKNAKREELIGLRDCKHCSKPLTEDEKIINKRFLQQKESEEIVPICTQCNF